MNHIVAIVLFEFDVNERGETIANNIYCNSLFQAYQPKGW